MNSVDHIIRELTEKQFSLKVFIRENLNGILTTIIFHLLVLICFLVFKIDYYRQIKELGIVLDFTYEVNKTEEEILLSQEEAAKIEMFERLLERALRAGNQPVNISEQLEKQISTDLFVNEVERLLNESRSEEERKRLQALEELLAEGVIKPEKQTDDLHHVPEFQGPTRISYEFLDPPFNRYARYMPVPVYTCEGDGVVEVEILVDRSGNVTSARPVIIGSPHDASCLAEAAVKYAILSKFTVNSNAPRNHKGKIRYSFVAQ